MESPAVADQVSHRLDGFKQVGPIPPGSTLEFDLELMDIQDPPGALEAFLYGVIYPRLASSELMVYLPVISLCILLFYVLRNYNLGPKRGGRVPYVPKKAPDGKKR